MANLYYNGILLPILPEIDETVYPYKSLVYINNSYYEIFFTSAQFTYDTTNEAYSIDSSATYTCYKLEDDEWVSSSSGTVPTSSFPITTYSAKWSNYDVLNTDGTTYLPATYPGSIYWDIHDTENRTVVLLDFGDDIIFEYAYKISDTVFTYDQLQQYTLTELIDNEVTIYDNTTAPAGVENGLNVAIFCGDCLIIPYDNYTLDDGETTLVFPEKGTYAFNINLFGDYTTGSITLNVTGDPVVLYEGDVTAVEGATEGLLTFNNFLSKKDVLMVNVDEDEYVDEVTTTDSGSLLYFGSYLSDDMEPDFSDSDRSYCAVQIDIAEPTSSVGVFMNEDTTKHFKIVRYLPGDLNKLTREIVVYVRSPLGVGQTAQVQIVSDNAADESPSYTYSTYSSYFSISETGLVTGIAKGYGSLYVDSEATENYHAISQYTSMTIQTDPVDTSKENRQLTVSVDTIFDVGESSQISIIDNAHSDSPTYTFSSSNEDIATVDDTGKVTGIAGGEVTITITAPETENYFSKVYEATFTITVNGEIVKNPRTITASTVGYSLLIGDATTITIEDNASDDSPTYVYTSSDETIATVNDSGVVTALAGGSVNITITSEETDSYEAGSTVIKISISTDSLRNYNTVEDILAAGTTNMTVIRNNSKQDDGTDTVTGADWLTFLGNTISTIYASGNSWFGLGSSTEHIKVNRRDCAMYYLYREEAKLSNYYKFIKVRWSGYSYYGTTATTAKLTYDIIFWETGDISIHMIDIPTSYTDGTYSFVADQTYTYTVSTDSPDVTFLIQEDGTYVVSNELVDLVRYEYVSEGYVEFVVDDIDITEVLCVIVKVGAEVIENTSMTLYAKVDDGEYEEFENGKELSCVTRGMDLSTSKIYIKIVLKSDDIYVSPTVNTINVIARDLEDEKIILLTTEEGNLKSIQNAVGDVTVTYDGLGTLKGEGGFVEAFEESFTPQGLVPKNDHNHTEHIEIADMDVSGVITPVTYHNFKTADEHIEIADMDVSGVLTPVTYTDLYDGGEHIEITDMDVSGVITPVTYHNFKTADEHIEIVNMVASLTLTHIDDIE